MSKTPKCKHCGKFIRNKKYLEDWTATNINTEMLRFFNGFEQEEKKEEEIEEKFFRDVADIKVSLQLIVKCLSKITYEDSTARDIKHIAGALWILKDNYMRQMNKPWYKKVFGL